MSTSNHIFTKFSLLDPALMAKQINTALGSNAVTNFGLLDPHLMEKQIEVGTSEPTVFAIKSLYDPKWTPDDLATAMGLNTSP